VIMAMTSTTIRRDVILGNWSFKVLPLSTIDMDDQ